MNDLITSFNGTDGKEYKIDTRIYIGTLTGRALEKGLTYSNAETVRKTRFGGCRRHDWRSIRCVF